MDNIEPGRTSPFDVIPGPYAESEDIAMVPIMQEFVDYIWAQIGPEVMRHIVEYGEVDWKKIRELLDA
jgi:hypothetical protein